MCGDIEYGKCEVCGKEGQLIRTYFHYSLKCECHSPNHFYLVRHCESCVPKEPPYQKVEFKTDDLKNPVPGRFEIHVKNQLNDNLVIGFCCGAKEYTLQPEEEVIIEITEDVCMYFDNACKVEGK